MKRRDAAFVLVFVLALGLALWQGSSGNVAETGIKSVEIGVATLSLKAGAEGLAIPASCPSYEHYPGECSGGGGNGGGGGGGGNGNGGNGNGGGGAPAACVPDGNCSAPAPSCGQTTSGSDSCGNSCSRTGPACPPAVGIFVNGQSSVTLFAPASFTITWSSANADSCSATGAWSGSKPTSGSQSFSNVSTGIYNFGLLCTGPGGSAYNSVTVKVTTVHEVAP